MKIRLRKNVNRIIYRKDTNLYELRVANTKDIGSDSYQFITVKLYDTNDVNSAEKNFTRRNAIYKKD